MDEQDKLDLPSELRAFFDDTNDNVDDAILTFMRLQDKKHKHGIPTCALENYFVYKTLIMEKRRLYSRLKSLQTYGFIKKVKYDGFVFYKINKCKRKEN